MCGVCFVYIFPSFRFLFVMFCLSFCFSSCFTCFVFCFVLFLFTFLCIWIILSPIVIIPNSFVLTPFRKPPLSPPRRLYASWKLCVRHADHTRQHMACASCKHMAYLPHWGDAVKRGGLNTCLLRDVQRVRDLRLATIFVIRDLPKVRDLRHVTCCHAPDTCDTA